MHTQAFTKCIALLLALCMLSLGSIALASDGIAPGHAHDFGAGVVMATPAVTMDGENACPSAAFTDMPAPDNWAHSGIDYCVAHGLMRGVSKTTFAPDAPTSRAMVVAILWRQAGSPAPGQENPFTDLRQDWYIDAVAWAAENGVVFGTDATTFDPDAAITRQDMTVIFYRYAKNVLNLDVSRTAALTAFPDHNRVSGYARDAMAWATAVGLISGTAVNGTVYLDPTGCATRAQTARILMNFCKHLERRDRTADVPVLLYHHLDPNADGGNSMVITPATFARQIQALHDAGYTGVSVEELQSYVHDGTPLPERPIVITFDDGYLSNYEYAFPILQKYGMKATIFVIGSSVGHTEFYKGTTHPVTPHFGAAEIAEMIASGLIEIQSHTYDMHQMPAYETGVARPTIQQLPDETDADYIQALTEDARLQKDLLEPMTGQKIVAVAYPLGAYSPLTCTTLSQCGIEATFTTISGSNTIEKGVPQSLMNLNRYGVYESTTPERLLAMVASARG